MALSQPSFKQYCYGLDEECFVLVDESIEVPADYNHKNFKKLPILKTARETVGKMQTVNIVSVGAINEILKLSSIENLEKAVLMHIPKGTEELNLKALAEGAKIAK